MGQAWEQGARREVYAGRKYLQLPVLFQRVDCKDMERMGTSRKFLMTIFSSIPAPWVSLLSFFVLLLSP
jgi:hypothetical protein